MKLHGLVFGLRVSKSFYLEDKLGAIVDELLYTKDSAFGPTLFPTVREGNGAKVLYNEKTEDKFTVTHSDFIFEYTIRKDFETEYQKYLDSYRDLIIKSIFKKFDVRNIARYGFIIKAELEKMDTITSSVNEIIRNSHNGYTPDSYSLRYNVREKKPVKIKDFVSEDFQNTIVTYDKPNEDSPLMFSVDYQWYFKPELNSIGEAPIAFVDFCKSSYNKYKQDYFEK